MIDGIEYSVNKINLNDLTWRDVTPRDQAPPYIAMTTRGIEPWGLWADHLQTPLQKSLFSGMWIWCNIAGMSKYDTE